jgi:hypothetical protein
VLISLSVVTQLRCRIVTFSKTSITCETPTVLDAQLINQVLPILIINKVQYESKCASTV